MTVPTEQVAQWINAAHAANARGAFAAAADLCRRSLATVPDVPEAWYHLGSLLARLDRKEEAEAAFRQAIADIPAEALRAGLRERGAALPLSDAKRYARNLETCWRGMWTELCRARTGHAWLFSPRCMETVLVRHA